MKDKDCPFCNGIIEDNQGMIYKDDKVLVFPTNIPITPGHILICPIRHVATIEDLTTEESVALQNMVVRLRGILKEVFDVGGFNFAWNEGSVAGQSVNHLHIHIVPRKEGDEGIYKYNPREFLYRTGSRAESPKEELKEVTKIIKEKI